MYEPVRRCRNAKTFLRVERAAEDGTPRQFWSPCSPGTPGAVEMTLMQIKPEELLAPEVLPGDFDAALRKVRPSVSPDDLRQFQVFTKMYGLEGDSESAAAFEARGQIDPVIDGGNSKPLFLHNLGCKTSADMCICS